VYGVDWDFFGLDIQDLKGAFFQTWESLVPVVMSIIFPPWNEFFWSICRIVGNDNNLREACFELLIGVVKANFQCLISLTSTNIILVQKCLDLRAFVLPTRFDINALFVDIVVAIESNFHESLGRILTVIDKNLLDSIEHYLNGWLGLADQTSHWFSCVYQDHAFGYFAGNTLIQLVILELDFVFLLLNLLKELLAPWDFFFMTSL
jgi:hypothetical protein